MPTLALRITRLPMMLLWAICFCGCIIVSDASCKAGERVGTKQSCEPCYEGFYQPTENDSQECQVCTRCDKGSRAASRCSSTTNTVCQCLKGFLPRESDSSTCKCDLGYGIQDNECQECENGFFTSAINTQCQAWRTCKDNRVQVNGTKTSDAVCHEPLDPLTPASMTPALKTETTSPSAPSTAPPPVITTGLPHLKTTFRHTPVSFDTNHVVVSVAAGVFVGLLVLIAVAIRCKAKEGPQYKRPIKETQQGKSHVIDI